MVNAGPEMAKRVMVGRGSAGGIVLVMVISIVLLPVLSTRKALYPAGTVPSAKLA